MDSYNILAIKDREQMVRFFDGFSADLSAADQPLILKRPLVKTHLVEMVDHKETADVEGIQELFKRSDLRLKPLDDAFFLVSQKRQAIGFLERLGPRLAAIYSSIDAGNLKTIIQKAIRKNPELDHVWFSGIAFNVLWELVASITEKHRYTKLVFSHESLYDVDPEDKHFAPDRELPAIGGRDHDLPEIDERRLASFRLADRIRIVAEKLRDFQRIYEPLYAIGQLRIPSPAGRGGHDVYFNGQVTNRSESFLDHRLHVTYLSQVYALTLREMESQCWYSCSAHNEKKGGHGFSFKGAPVVIKFKGDGLPEHVFHRWVASTFQLKGNRFRLWGQPTWHGSGRIHVDAVDLHLWQPLSMDISRTRCIILLPQGTCSNSIHRLITNIQKYLDPGAEAFLGDIPYREVFKSAATAVNYAPASK